MNHNPLLARFENQPALVEPQFQGIFQTSLIEAAKILEGMERADSSMDDDFWCEDLAWARPYNVQNGILQIPVKGVLLHDFPYQFGSWATGYDYIWRTFQRGAGDFVTGAIKGIALVENTPGGDVAGCFDATDKMVALKNSTKVPVRAFAMESAYSAGYAVASVADHIAVSRTGGVGSIGVVTSHVDYSGAMEKAGIKFTFIKFGDHKVDGNPYEPLPKDVEARIQARIDELGQIFVSTVARNRGMSEEAVRNTQALCFTASEAVSNGLADSIGSFDDAIAAFAADLSLAQEDTTMTTAEEKAAAQAANDKIRTDAFAEGKALGAKEGSAQGATAERGRITAILTSEAAKTRGKTALKMATGEKFAALDAETIVEMLNDLPPEQAAVLQADPAASKGATGAAADFRAAMDASQHPDLGGTPPGAIEQAKPSRAEAALTMVKGPLKPEQRGAL